MQNMLFEKFNQESIEYNWKTCHLNTIPIKPTNLYQSVSLVQYSSNYCSVKVVDLLSNDNSLYFHKSRTYSRGAARVEQQHKKAVGKSQNSKVGKSEHSLPKWKF